MFCTQAGSPARSENGFFDFFDQTMLPLMQSQEAGARLMAQHVIAPVLSPADREFFTQTVRGDIAASEVIGPSYTGRAATARKLGCTITRLQITLGSEQSEPQGGAFLRWQRDICAPIHAEVGEGCQVAWWDNHEQELAAALADDAGQQLLDEFNAGITLNVPTGGYWALYGGPAAQELLAAAEVKYRRGRMEAEFDGFDIYTPDQLTDASRRYIGFWSNVVSTQQSTALYDTVPIS